VHLLRSGYKRIAFLGNAAHLSIIRERLAGYLDAHRDHQMPVDESMIKYCPHGGLIYAEAEDAIKSLLKARKKPDAILACADKLTTNCLRYFHAHKIKVPGSIALVGFSNLDLTELLNPSLSVIRQPAFEIGQQSMELLLQLIESKRPVRTFETRSLPAQLFIRESSARSGKGVVDMGK
jgi:LacI family transcriptional regulator